jgi:hypothetical protein
MREVSRRSVVRHIPGAASAAVVIAATLAVTRSRAAGGVPQSAAGYQNAPNGDKRCDGCTHFDAPSSCKVVAGTISPSGWCKLYAAKS